MRSHHTVWLAFLGILAALMVTMIAAAITDATQPKANLWTETPMFVAYGLAGVAAYVFLAILNDWKLPEGKSGPTTMRAIHLRLGNYIQEANELFSAQVTSQAEFDAWSKRVDKWTKKTLSWLNEALPISASARFAAMDRPGYTFGNSFNRDHDDIRSLLLKRKGVLEDVARDHDFLSLAK